MSNAASTADLITPANPPTPANPSAPENSSAPENLSAPVSPSAPTDQQPQVVSRFVAGLKWVWNKYLYLIAGEEIAADETLRNYLIRKAKEGERENSEIDVSVIVDRAKHLIQCNLADAREHFMLAAALLTSQSLHENEKLKEDTRLGCPRCADKEALGTIQQSSHQRDDADDVIIPHRPMTAEEQEGFRSDRQGNVLHRLGRQPWAMWQLMLLCGLGAMVQGWDEAAINGAQVYYQLAYRFDPNDLRIGYLNSAPYAFCVISCWLSWPLNAAIGRRGTIFFAAFVSFAFALGQSFANTWVQMLILRLFLGLGIGPKSATIPIYASEVAPTDIRGALVMLWQLFTALGIMFGYLVGVAFASLGEGNAAINRQSPCTNNDDLLSFACSINWRMMIGSPMVAPIFLCLYIYLQPESPRWLLAEAQRIERANEKKAKKAPSPNTQQPPHEEANNPENSLQSAQHGQQSSMQPLQIGEQQLSLRDDHKPIDLQPVYQSMVRLRGGRTLKAARDMLTLDVLLYDQKDSNRDKMDKKDKHESSDDTQEASDQSRTVTFRFKERKERLAKQLHRAKEQLKLLFTEPRNFNALTASTTVLFLQQFCGINILIYYSTLVLFRTEAGKPLFFGNVPRFIVLSTGVGVLNFLFGLPALFAIDRRGRRRLLLHTFPWLGIFSMVVAVFSREQFYGTPAQTWGVFSGMLCFVAFYSPGEGPVPFVYASESFPQDMRDLGMSVVTSINWGLNFLVAITFPYMTQKDKGFGVAGTFGWYSGWCFFGVLLIIFFVPETCQKELEALDEEFEGKWWPWAKKNAAPAWKAVGKFFRKAGWNSRAFEQRWTTFRTGMGNVFGPPRNLHRRTLSAESGIKLE